MKKPSNFFSGVDLLLRPDLHRHLAEHQPEVDGHRGQDPTVGGQSIRNVVLFFLNGPYPTSFSFIFIGPKMNYSWQTFKVLPMMGFDLRISGNGSDRSANCATTTALCYEFLSFPTLQYKYCKIFSWDWTRIFVGKKLAKWIQPFEFYLRIP